MAGPEFVVLVLCNDRNYAVPSSGGIAFITLVTCLSMTTQAADTTLTLACQGTVKSATEDTKPEPVSKGIIVNFANRTVQGFGDLNLGDYPVMITAWNDVAVAFSGSRDDGFSKATIIGSGICGAFTRRTIEPGKARHAAAWHDPALQPAT